MSPSGAPRISKWFPDIWKNCGILLYCICFRRVRAFAKSASYLRHINQYLHIYQLGPTGWISVKFDIGNFHENSSRNSKSGYNKKNIPGTLQVHLTAFNFCRRHKFAKKSFFCNIQYFYVYDSDV